MKMANRFFLANRKLYLGASLFLLIFLGGAAGRVSAADCDNNAIIHCGITSPSNFIGLVKIGNSNNGHSDLQAIYQDAGLVPADYARFVTSSVAGTAYKTYKGTPNVIVVDGQVVATNVKSIGRQASLQGPGYFTRTIPGAGTFYGNTNDKAFAATTDSIPVTVLFNAQGVVQFAVLNSCGNPIYASYETPSYSCNLIHQSAVPGKPGSFNFTTDASAGNNATISKVVYTFGDGSTATAPTAGTVVNHVYAKDGNYTATVTVYVHLPGNQTITVTSAKCATVVVVALPAYQCTQLAAATIGNSKYQYQYIVTGKATNGASLTSADFTFGDGGAAKGIALTGGTTATTTYTYTKDGSFPATATFHVKLPTGATTTVTSAGCATKVPVAIPYYDCAQLGGAILDASKFSYSFTASADYGNGVTFTGADFDFGDQVVTRGVAPTGTSVTTTHTYATAGNYTATATLYFLVNGNTHDVKTVQCTASLTPTQPPTPECKPGVPEGSALCTPCQYNSQLSSTDTACVAPTTSLPNTGAGDVIAIFGAAAVGGFLIFRQLISRRNAMASAGTMTTEGLFVGPVVSPDTGVVVSHHADSKHHRKHPNAVHPLHHPSYQHPHRFRPTTHKPDDE